MMRTADFLNASRLIQDSIFSCAVDSFLETIFVVLCRLIGNLERKSASSLINFLHVLNDIVLY